MRILALEFSSPERSVAVAELVGSNFRVLADVSDQNVRGTTGVALAQRALEHSKLTARDVELVAVGLGPGSYTGIRCAIAIAQGWQLGMDIRVVGISSVEVLARQCAAAGIFGHVQVIIDAQRNEFYSAEYEISSGNVLLRSPLRIVPAAAIQPSQALIVGPEASAVVSHGQMLAPSARMLAELAGNSSDFVPSEALEPIYLRPVSFVKAALPRQF